MRNKKWGRLTADLNGEATWFSRIPFSICDLKDGIDSYNVYECNELCASAILHTDRKISCPHTTRARLCSQVDERSIIGIISRIYAGVEKSVQMLREKINSWHLCESKNGRERCGFNKRKKNTDQVIGSWQNIWLKTTSNEKVRILTNTVIPCK